MIPQEHRIIAALEHLGPMVIPDYNRPRWWERTARKRDRAIQDALAAAGLPALSSIGRLIFIEIPHDLGAINPTDFWTQMWCRALRLPFRSARDRDVIVDPRTNQRSTMTAHERIQLLREEQEVAKNLAGARRSVTPRTDIPSETPGVEP